MRTLIWKLCENCGTEFGVRPYRRLTARTCCTRCANTLRSRENAEKIGNALRYRGTKTRYVKYKGRHMHRVVAEQKLGRPLLPGEIVHHDDDDGWNNEPENLVVTTQNKHIRIHHRAIIEARKKAGFLTGESHPRHKLTKERVDEIRRSGESNVALAARFSVTSQAISAVRKGKVWRSS